MPFLWPTDRLGEALEALVKQSGLMSKNLAEALTVPPSFLESSRVDTSVWINWAADRLGIEAISVDTAVGDIEAFLKSSYPLIAVVQLDDVDGVFLIVSCKWGVPHLLRTDLVVAPCKAAHIAAVLTDYLEGDLLREADDLLAATAIAGERRASVRAALVKNQLASKQIGWMWMLRLPASASYSKQLIAARVPQKITAMLVIFLLVYCFEIGGWSLIGGAALDGRLDWGWMAAWALLIATVIPLRALGGWFSAMFALDAGRILKTRLLAGALEIEPSEVKQHGVGHLLGKVMESQALEALVLGGGIAALTSALELVLSAWILTQGVAPVPHIILLMIWVLIGGILCWRYYGTLDGWTRQRVDMTHKMVEAMVGHRTRLAQERDGRRPAREDIDLDHYLGLSKEFDKTGVLITIGLSSGWMIFGIIGFMPAFVTSADISPTAIAISVGGLLLAGRAITGLAGGVAGLARAHIAWRQVASLFRAARMRAPSQRFLSDAHIAAGADGASLVDAQALTFGYNAARDPVLKGVNIEIKPGDRILLAGASGTGKSTLSSLLSGLTVPDSGLLLLNGLDRATLGDDWHRIATAAPQFHDNHILAGTLAFNLLMGKRWPPDPQHVAEAQDVCIELGLGGLIQRMPGGMNQIVGETGWQLSHGERSRIFLARALLQNAPLTILDESFAALDPETLNHCIECAFRRSNALIVIAHP